MKKRIFLPVSIGFILVNLFLWLLTLICIVILFLGLFDKITGINKLEAPILIIAAIFLLYSSIRFLLAFKIHLRGTDIATFGDGLPKFEKIQYKCFVNYNEIKSIAIVASEKNSKNQRIQLKWVSSSMGKKYLEFTLIDNKKKRMCINYYNKKQIIKMLNYINDNMQEAGNTTNLDIEEIMKDWYVYGGYNREDLKLKRGENIKKKTTHKKNSETKENSNNEIAKKDID